MLSVGAGFGDAADFEAADGSEEFMRLVTCAVHVTLPVLYSSAVHTHVTRARPFASAEQIFKASGMARSMRQDSEEW